jgi:hypothetical protein
VLHIMGLARNLIFVKKMSDGKRCDDINEMSSDWYLVQAVREC